MQHSLRPSPMDEKRKEMRPSVVGKTPFSISVSEHAVPEPSSSAAAPSSSSSVSQPPSSATAGSASAAAAASAVSAVAASVPIASSSAAAVVGASSSGAASAAPPSAPKDVGAPVYTMRGRFEVGEEMRYSLNDWESLPKAPAGFYDSMRLALPILHGSGVVDALELSAPPVASAMDALHSVFAQRELRRAQTSSTLSAAAPAAAAAPPGEEGGAAFSSLSSSTATATSAATAAAASAAAAAASAAQVAHASQQYATILSALENISMRLAPLEASNATGSSSAPSWSAVGGGGGGGANSGNGGQRRIAQGDSNSNVVFSAHTLPNVSSFRGGVPSAQPANFDVDDPSTLN